MKSRKIKTLVYNFIYSFLSEKARMNLKLKNNKYIKLNVNDYIYWQKRYPKLIFRLKNKLKQGEKIRVAFLVHWVSSWSSEVIMKKMMNDPLFDISIIVAPVLVYDFKCAISIYNENLKIIKAQYEDKVEILEGYNSEKKQMVDYLNSFDIIFIPSNDENIEFKEYKIYNILKKDVIPCYICYAYYAAKDDAILTDTYNLCWKVFVENELNLQDLEQRQPLKGQNAVVSGYPKADNFYNLSKHYRDKKNIIIAPHHSIHGIGLQSQFLKYSDFFLNLPKLYPDINFIFRPHPLLYDTLIQPKYWGEKKTKEYYEQISSYDNCFYDTESKYYQTFIDSDGIIHDCGSFLPEYLFTNNPPCYLLKNTEAVKEYFGPFGRQCLDVYYKAFNKNDIISYIENVVIKGNDFLQTKRENFSKKVIKYNFPHAAEYITQYIKEQFS